MKTPDEIKRALKLCVENTDAGCQPDCPYYASKCRVTESEIMPIDALALIQQLQAELKDEKNNHQHTIEIAERQKEQIKKLKNVIVRLNNERAHRDDQCGHAGPGIRDNY